MLDVHPPHAPTHTWKDFLLHIATIVVGLIIAVGLEQTVEAVHRHSELHQLEVDLHEESQANLGRASRNLAHIDQDLAWLFLLRSRVDAVRDGTNNQSFNYPPQLRGFPGDPAFPDRVLPHDTAWIAAKQNATISLLPPDDLQFYGILYRVTDKYSESFDSLTLQWKDLTSINLQYQRGTSPGQVDIGRMSHEQLDKYAAIIAGLIASSLDTKRHLQISLAYTSSALAARINPDMGQYFHDNPDPVPAFNPTPIH
jgi:hypothetical protein